MDEISRAGFKKPTPIQSQGDDIMLLLAFSIALNGNDLIGIA
jgi:superfamily II DNA/RNA helicase